MRTTVAAIVARKGAPVTTIAPTARVADAAALLARERIGAVVVSGDGRAIEGVLSERDIVRQLAANGASALELPIDQVMTTEVMTCGWESTTDELATLMTERRFRHVPVVEDGVLVGIVSIGDVVRSRLDELAAESEQLQAYVSGGY